MDALDTVENKQTDNISFFHAAERTFQFWRLWDPPRPARCTCQNGPGRWTQRSMCYGTCSDLFWRFLSIGRPFGQVGARPLLMNGDRCRYKGHVTSRADPSRGRLQVVRPIVVPVDGC